MSPTPLPDDLAAAVTRLVEAAGLSGAPARRLREDLETHVRDALEAGRSADEVLRRLGEPDEVAPMLAESPRPRRRRPAPSTGESAIRAFWTDARQGARSLARTPSLAFTATLVLGLGIAAAAVALTVVNELFLRPLPVADQDRLVDVWADVSGGNSFAGFGWSDVVAYREGAVSDPDAGPSGPLRSLAAFAGTRLTLGEGGAGRPAVGQLVSREYFPLLGLQPAAGTLDLPEDPGFGGPRIAILSHGLWTDAFDADPGIVGRTLVVDGESVAVAGVAPAGFRGHFTGFPVDLWLPITTADLFFPAFDPGDRARMPFEMIGRLADGGTPAAAEAVLDATAADLAVAYPETHRGHGVGVTPTTGVDHSLHAVVLAFVGILGALAGLVLVIACLNVGSLLLARTLSREREIAVRLALGAGNGRLVRQMLAEASVLAASGAAVGLLLSRLLGARVDALLRRLAPGLGLELPFDGRVLALTMTAALAAALVAGAAPGLHVLRKAPGDRLRGRGGSGSGSRGRGILVAAQIGASLSLVITTGLFVRALSAGLRVDPGFAADEVATLVVEADAMDGGASMDDLLRDARGLPGVRGVTLADAPPTGVARTPVRLGIPGTDPPPDEGAWVVDARRVGADYLATVGIALRQGRDVQEADTRDGPPTAVVSQGFVDRFWPGDEGVVGRWLDVGDEVVQVVGVATDARFLVQDDTPDPFVYLSLSPPVPPRVVLTVRGPDPGSLTAPLRDLLRIHRPDAPPPQVTVARETLDAGLLPQRLGAALVGALGAAALILAIVGLYGLIRYTVSRDRHEIAVRMALGGSRATVLGAVLKRAGTFVGAGLLGGVLATAAGARVLAGFLGGVSPLDPLTYGVVTGLFLALAGVASALPARRALSIPPASALRGE